MDRDYHIHLKVSGLWANSVDPDKIFERNPPPPPPPPKKKKKKKKNAPFFINLIFFYITPITQKA